MPPARGHHHPAAQRRARRLRDLAARQHQEPPRARRAWSTRSFATSPTSTTTSTPTPNPRSWRCVPSRILARCITRAPRRRTTAPDALEVLRMLHPTAAVGGIPRASAYDLICRLEAARPRVLRRTRRMDRRQRRRRVVDRLARRAFEWRRIRSVGRARELSASPIPSPNAKRRKTNSPSCCPRSSSTASSAA